MSKTPNTKTPEALTEAAVPRRPIPESAVRLDWAGNLSQRWDVTLPRDMTFQEAVEPSAWATVRGSRAFNFAVGDEFRLWNADRTAMAEALLIEVLPGAIRLKLKGVTDMTPVHPYKTAGGYRVEPVPGGNYRIISPRGVQIGGVFGSEAMANAALDAMTGSAA